jgi:NADH:ubiquinone oxidoreductase subunit 5 (subunit L)/multisubunit Na+/H+ antiporter MnhA subunit
MKHCFGQAEGTTSETSLPWFPFYDGSSDVRIQPTEVKMTLLIMFCGFMAAVSALTYMEVRRIRKKLSSK